MFSVGCLITSVVIRFETQYNNYFPSISVFRQLRNKWVTLSWLIRLITYQEFKTSWKQLRRSTLSLVLRQAKHTSFSHILMESSPCSPSLSCVHPFQGCEVTGAGHSSHWEALCLHLPAATHHIRRPSTAAHDGLWWVLCLRAELLWAAGWYCFD